MGKLRKIFFYRADMNLQLDINNFLYPVQYTLQLHLEMQQFSYLRSLRPNFWHFEDYYSMCGK